MMHFRFESKSLLTFTNTAFANWVGGIVYNQLDDGDISLGGVGLTIGYQFDYSTSVFSLTPEIRAGVGIGDETFRGVDVEIDTYYGINVRGQWDFSNGTYLFVAPSYMHLKLEVSGGGLSASSSSWEFGGGVGAGFSFTETISAELSYEKFDDFDDLDVLGLGLRFKF